MSSSGLNCNERQSQYYASRLDYPVVTSTFQKQVDGFLFSTALRKKDTPLGMRPYDSLIFLG